MEARVFRAALVAALVASAAGARYPTANFIIETSHPQLARAFGDAAEKYRRELAVAWLGEEMPNWSQPCVITVRVGENLGAGGATSFVFDQGEVFGWRMTIQGSRQRVLDSVLPHEITHMIFASHFRQPLPRWCDEGGATSVECASERLRHHKMLGRFLTTGRGIALNRMFGMRQYPRDVMPLYAQGFSLAEYLICLGGRRKYIEFMGDGLRTDDWPGAIQRNYGFAGTSGLQNHWLAWVRQGSPPFQRRQPARPAATPETPPEVEIVAGGRPEPTAVAAGRLPRPKPNLIYHEPLAYAPGSVIPDRPMAGTRAPTHLAATGWHAPGAEAPTSSTAAATRSAAAGPLRDQVTCPQPIQQAGQGLWR